MACIVGLILAVALPLPGREIIPNSPIRTITLGLANAHPLSHTAIQHASTVLAQASTRYSEVGYEVQTVRLSTRPVFDDLADWSSVAIDS